MKKYEFIRFIKQLPDPETYSYLYECGNDEFRKLNWQRRTADYQFGIINQEKKFLCLESGTTSKDVHELKQSLEEKYTRWAREAKGMPKLTNYE